MADTPSPKDPNFYATVQRLQLEQWVRDQNDGVTLRSIHTKLTEHLTEDKGFHDSMRERLASLEADAERDAEERQGEQLARAAGIGAEMGTGRYHVAPPGTVPMPVAAPVAISVNASSGTDSARTSRRPAHDPKSSVFNDRMKERLVYAIAMLLLTVFGYLTHYLQGIASQHPPPPALSPAHSSAQP
jgi:hypothetical protein